MKIPPSHQMGAHVSRNRWVLSIFLTALFLRMIYFVQSGDNPLLYYPVLDEVYYIELGKTIAGGFWLGEGRVFFMDPLYGYFLSPFFFFFGDNLTTIRLFQILLDSLHVLLIYVLGTRVWGRSAGIVAGLLYALYKVAFFYTLLTLKTTLSVTISLVFILALLRVIERRDSFQWILLGALAAVMVYLRANFLLIVPLTILFYWVLERPGWRAFLGHGILFVTGFMVLLSLGALRNYYVSDELVLMNTQSGRLLYSCNNPENLTGRYNVPSFSRPHPEDSEVDFHKEAEGRLGRSLSVKESSLYWTGETVRFLKKNPRAAAVLIKNKLKGTVADHEIPVNHSYYVAAKFSGMTRWPLPTFAFAFAFGVPGLIIGCLSRKKAIWLLLPLLMTLITVTVFYTSSRFRMPAVPFLLIGAGICLVTLAGWVRGKDIKKISGLTLIIALLYTCSITASEPKYSGTEEFYLAKAYWTQKQFNRARAVASDAAIRFPGQARFPVLLGMIALSEDRLEKAIQYNLTALNINPEHADAYHNLGLTYLFAGRSEEAVKAISRAISLASKNRYLFTLAKAYDEMGERLKAVKFYSEYLKASKPTAPYREVAMERLSELDRN